MQMNIKKTRDIKNPHYYVQALTSEYAAWAFDEERATQFNGLWRSEIFKVGPDHPLDLEIGTGNGYFFSHQAYTHRERSLIGVELKYKPLIQSIRRALFTGAINMRIARFDARFVDRMFAESELDNIFIHHPDPWEKKRRKQKHRLMQADFFNSLYKLQKPGSQIEIKTDSRDYFLWLTEEIKKVPYQLEKYTLDLHQSEFAPQNFITHFEQIFIRQGVPINYLTLRKPLT